MLERGSAILWVIGLVNQPETLLGTRSVNLLVIALEVLSGSVLGTDLELQLGIEQEILSG
jgi:hypothetical protein